MLAGAWRYCTTFTLDLCRILMGIPVPDNLRHLLDVYPNLENAIRHLHSKKILSREAIHFLLRDPKNALNIAVCVTLFSQKNLLNDKSQPNQTDISFNCPNAELILSHWCQSDERVNLLEELLEEFASILTETMHSCFIQYSDHVENIANIRVAIKCLRESNSTYQINLLTDENIAQLSKHPNIIATLVSKFSQGELNQVVLDTLFALDRSVIPQLHQLLSTNNTQSNSEINQGLVSKTNKI